MLCERVGKRISFNKISKALDISKDSVKQYIHYFIEAYLFFIVEKKAKLNARILEEKKIYCADAGIKNITAGFRDKGAIYENLVFLKIKDKKPSFIIEGGIEIDFSFSNTLIEAKFDSDIEGKQKRLFEKLRYKNKIMAKGAEFFIEDFF